MQYVSIAKCSDYNEENVYKAVEDIVNKLGGWKKYIKPGNTVVVKPNLLMPKKPDEAATTHPAVVKAVVSQVQKAGGIVTIAESPGGPYGYTYLKHVYKVTGIERVADETGAILNYDLRVQGKNHPQAKYIKQLEVIRPIAEADIIINLPKLKTHTMMAYSGAVKNMFGAVAGTTKADFHLRMPDYMDFADCLIDIFLSVKPTLNIMDAVYGMEGYGPSAGKPRKIGILLASTNGFALDCAALNVIGLPFEKVPIIKQANKREFIREDYCVWGCDIKDITINDYAIPVLNDTERCNAFDRGFLKLAKRWLRPKPVIDQNTCVRCGNCARNCPPKVINIEKGKSPYIDYRKCIRCFCCHELCSYKAITIHRNIISKLMTDKRLAGLK